MGYLLLCLFGCGVGVLSGLLGIGGGVAMVPGLMYLFGYSQAQAQGTSLAVMIPPIGIFAALVYWQNGYVQLPVVGWIAAGFVAGAYLGAKLVGHLALIPGGKDLLTVAFGLLLIYSGFLFVSKPLTTRSGAALPAGIATLVAAVFGLWTRRRRRRSHLTPPSDEIEYHI